jgi:hypothetical protein
MAKGDIIDGIFGALGAGLSAAGGEDIYREFMTSLRDKQAKGLSTEKQDKINFGKIRLAALGHDVSKINSEEDLVAAEGLIANKANRHNTAIEQFNQAVETQEGMLSQFRDQPVPIDERQMGGWFQADGQVERALGLIRDTAPPGFDLATYENRRLSTVRSFEEVGAMSDARGLGALLSGRNPDYQTAAATLNAMPPESRSRNWALQNPSVAAAYGGAEDAFRLAAGLRPQGNSWIGPPGLVRLRQAIDDGEGGVLPWSQVSGNDDMLASFMATGSDASLGSKVQTAQTKAESDAEESSVRDLLGGFGISPPDGNYRREDGSFDKVSFTRAAFDPLMGNLGAAKTPDLANMVSRMKSLATGQPGDPMTAVIADYAQQVNRELLDRFAGDPDLPAQMQEASDKAQGEAFRGFLNETIAENRAVPSFETAFPEAFPVITQTTVGGAFTRSNTATGERRSPRTRDEREQAILDIQAAVNRGQGVPPVQWAFMRSIQDMSPEARETFLETGKPPEFDSDAAKSLFVDSVVADPMTGFNYRDLEDEMLNVALDLESVGMSSFAAARADAAYYGNLATGREVGAQGLRTIGLALGAYAETGDIEDIVARLAGDYPASDQQQATGQPAIERLGLANFESELAKAEGTGEKGMILLRNVENGVLKAADHQFGTAGERQQARDEAAIILGRVRERLQDLINFQNETLLSDAEMARRFGGKGDDWTSPLFAALGDAALGL